MSFFQLSQIPKAVVLSSRTLGSQLNLTAAFDDHFAVTLQLKNHIKQKPPLKFL